MGSGMHVGNTMFVLHASDRKQHGACVPRQAGPGSACHSKHAPQNTEWWALDSGRWQLLKC